jgi:RNA polymerase sigma-70 factor (ECF subfamily)
MDDERLVDLVGRIARGDEQALAQLYDATCSRVYGLALRVTRAADEAEEVVSDAYLQVWRQASRYDPQRGAPLAWLLMITRSRALDRLRRRDAALPMAQVPEPDAPRGDDAEARVLSLERGGAVDEALRSLSRVQRELLELAFLGGRSHQEIARETGLPLGTVKSHLRRALQALAKALGPAPDEGSTT